MRSCLAGFMLIFAACGAKADEPLPAPTTVTACSTSKLYCALSAPDSNLTVVSSTHSQKPLWRFPRWHRWLFVSNDGNTVVAGYDGMNLVPVDVSLEEPVLFFYHRGTAAVHTVKLGELYRSKAELVRTVSHYNWVRSIAIISENQLEVYLIDYRRIVFDLDTAQVQDVAPDGS